jgi:hypothetical protein
MNWAEADTARGRGTVARAAEETWGREATSVRASTEVITKAVVTLRRTSALYHDSVELMDKL